MTPGVLDHRKFDSPESWETSRENARRRDKNRGVHLCRETILDNSI